MATKTETSKSADIPKLGKAEIIHLSSYLPHMHVIAHGSKEEKEALLKNASAGLIRALSLAVKQSGDGMNSIPGFIGTGIDTLMNSDERIDRKSNKFRKLAEDEIEKGSGFSDTMAQIGKTALQLAPALIPLLL